MEQSPCSARHALGLCQMDHEPRGPLDRFGRRRAEESTLAFTTLNDLMTWRRRKICALDELPLARRARHGRRDARTPGTPAPP